MLKSRLINRIDSQLLRARKGWGTEPFFEAEVGRAEAKALQTLLRRLVAATPQRTLDRLARDFAAEDFEDQFNQARARDQDAYEGGVAGVDY